MLTVGVAVPTLIGLTFHVKVDVPPAGIVTGELPEVSVKVKIPFVP